MKAKNLEFRAGENRSRGKGGGTRLSTLNSRLSTSSSGTVLILVIGILALIALIATTFLVASRYDRASAEFFVVENQIEMLLGIMDDHIQRTLAEDMWGNNETAGDRDVERYDAYDGAHPWMTMKDENGDGDPASTRKLIDWDDIEGLSGGWRYVGSGAPGADGSASTLPGDLKIRYVLVIQDCNGLLNINTHRQPGFDDRTTAWGRNEDDGHPEWGHWARDPLTNIHVVSHQTANITLALLQYTDSDDFFWRGGGPSSVVNLQRVLTGENVSTLDNVLRHATTEPYRVYFDIQTEMDLRFPNHRMRGAEFISLAERLLPNSFDAGLRRHVTAIAQTGDWWPERSPSGLPPYNANPSERDIRSIAEGWEKSNEIAKEYFAYLKYRRMNINPGFNLFSRDSTGIVISGTGTTKDGDMPAAADGDWNPHMMSVPYLNKRVAGRLLVGPNRSGQELVYDKMSEGTSGISRWLNYAAFVADDARTAANNADYANAGDAHQWGDWHKNYAGQCWLPLQLTLFLQAAKVVDVDTSINDAKAVEAKAKMTSFHLNMMDCTDPGGEACRFRPDAATPSNQYGGADWWEGWDTDKMGIERQPYISEVVITSIPWPDYFIVRDRAIKDTASTSYTASFLRTCITYVKAGSSAKDLGMEAGSTVANPVSGGTTETIIMLRWVRKSGTATWKKTQAAYGPTGHLHDYIVSLGLVIGTDKMDFKIDKQVIEYDASGAVVSKVTTEGYKEILGVSTGVGVGDVAVEIYNPWSESLKVYDHRWFLKQSDWNSTGSLTYFYVGRAWTLHIDDNKDDSVILCPANYLTLAEGLNAKDLIIPAKSSVVVHSGDASTFGLDPTNANVWGDGTLKGRWAYSTPQNTTRSLRYLAENDQIGQLALTRIARFQSDSDSHVCKSGSGDVFEHFAADRIKAVYADATNRGIEYARSLLTVAAYTAGNRAVRLYRNGYVESRARQLCDGVATVAVASNNLLIRNTLVGDQQTSARGLYWSVPNRPMKHAGELSRVWRHCLPKMPLADDAKVPTEWNEEVLSAAYTDSQAAGADVKRIFAEAEAKLRYHPYGPAGDRYNLDLFFTTGGCSYDGVDNNMDGQVDEHVPGGGFFTMDGGSHASSWSRGWIYESSGAFATAGRININTAPREVLLCLNVPADLRESLADNIIANRPFKSIPDLLERCVTSGSTTVGFDWYGRDGVDNHNDGTIDGWDDPDGMVDDADELQHLYAQNSEIITLRSDTFAVYFRIQVLHKGKPKVERRVFSIWDRSHCHYSPFKLKPDGTAARNADYSPPRPLGTQTFGH